MRATLVVCAVLIGLGACAPKQESGGSRTLTERQRDSLIGRSALPGAAVVQRAMSSTDAEARRAARMQAQVDSMPH